MTGIKFKEKLKISDEAKSLIFQVLLFGLGMALTPIKFMFGIYPFGIALLGACRRHAPFVFAGSVISVIFFMEADPVYIIALCALLALRLAAGFIKKRDERQPTLTKDKGSRIFSSLFCESVELRVILSSIACLGVGLFYVIYNGYKYYDIFVLVFLTVFGGIMTYSYTGAFESKKKSRAFIFALSSFSFAIIYGLAGVEIYGIDISVVFTYAIVLYLSKHISGSKAGIIGMILGIGGSLALAPVYGIAGIVSGFIWSISPYLSIMCALILSMGYGIFATGYEAISLLLPELLGVSLIMYPLLKFNIIPKPEFVKIEGQGIKNAREFFLEGENKRQRGRVEKLSLGFGKIAEILRSVSEKTRTVDRHDFSDMCLEVCEKHCYLCPKHQICWQRDIATTELNITKLGEAIFTKGEAGKGNVEEKFLHRCPNIEGMIEEMNKRGAEMRAQSVKTDKLDISTQDYDMTSRILGGTLEPDGGEVDNDLSERVIRAISKIGLCYDRAEVFSGKIKRAIITGIDLKRSNCTDEEIREEISISLGIAFSKPVIYESGAFATLEMEELPTLEIKSSHTSQAGEKEENGDSVSVFDGCNGKKYMLICDGMGSGAGASFTSGVCVSFLERLLSVTEGNEQALAMLNNFIRARNVECSSSVDLLEVDSYTGESRFFKSGAAPSYVKRGDNVFKLQSKTAPIGIMKKLDAEKLAFSLQRGDVLLMVSDGIVPEGQNDDWVTEYLRKYDKDANDLSGQIIAEAKKRLGAPHDDMTALCATVV